MRRMIHAPCLFGPAFVLLSILAACAAPKTGAPSFSFGLVADAQYCDGDPAGIRHYRNALDKLEACVDELNRHDLAFSIHLGDVIDRDFKSFDRVLPILARLEKPACHALGNHDFSVEDGLKTAVPSKLGMAGRHYDFSVHGFRFVVLDGNSVSLYAPAGEGDFIREARSAFQKLKDVKAPNAMPWNGAVGKVQRDWLEGVLDKASSAGEKVIVFSHFPVYPKNAHNCWDDEEIVRILEAHDNVAAYINGHNHAGNYGEKGGIHYLTLQGMVDTPDQNAFAVAKVFKDRIEIHGYGRVPSRTLSIRKRGEMRP